MNRFQQLYQQRKAQSTREFVGRGARKSRCERCQLPSKDCFCAAAKLGQSRCQFALLMNHKEVLRPSNTGRFIADVVPDTHAFIWDRTQVCEPLVTLTQQANVQAYVVFPAHLAGERQVLSEVPPSSQQQLLFIMLDGSWREARKIYNQSPWLAHLPVLSINPDKASSYGLRSSPLKQQWATAEVAAQLLALAGEKENAQALEQRFSQFTQITLANRSH